MLDNKLKKSFCKRVISKWLAQAILSINDTGIFQIYKAWLMVLNDYITWYDNNHKRFLFVSVLKSVVLESIVKLVKKEVIDWKVFVAAVNLNQKNICYIEKEENQKKRVK